MKKWTKFKSMEQAAEWVASGKEYKDEEGRFWSNPPTVKKLVNNWHNWEYPVERETRDLYQWAYLKSNAHGPESTIRYTEKPPSYVSQYLWVKRLDHTKITIDVETGEVVDE